jgi:hypothetical protein
MRINADERISKLGEWQIGKIPILVNLLLIDRS